MNTNKLSDQQKLTAVKIIHTVIWAWMVGVIMYVLYSGITGQVTTLTWVCVGIVFIEGLILLTFKMFCPLTLIARRYSQSTDDNFDIYLPNWLAKYNKVIFTTIFLFSLFLVIIRSI